MVWICKNAWCNKTLYHANTYILISKAVLLAKLLYKSKCPSFCLSVCMSLRFRGKRNFSAPNWDIAPFFFVQIPLINEHLFCKYFVRLVVRNAIKGFATYGCFHPCFHYKLKVVKVRLMNFKAFWCIKQILNIFFVWIKMFILAHSGIPINAILRKPKDKFIWTQSWLKKLALGSHLSYSFVLFYLSKLLIKAAPIMNTASKIE